MHLLHLELNTTSYIHLRPKFLVTASIRVVGFTAEQIKAENATLSAGYAGCNAPTMQYKSRVNQPKANLAAGFRTSSQKDSSSRPDLGSAT